MLKRNTYGPGVSSDRIFFPLIAVLCIGYVLYGFSPTYYFRSDAAPLSLLIHVHGFLFSTWLVLFLVQTILIRSGKPAVHRRLGTLGASLVPVIVIFGLIVTLVVSPTHPYADWEYAVTFQELIMFPAFVAAAVYYRRTSATHKRLMLMATFVIMAAATARWPAIGALFGYDSATGELAEWTLAYSTWMYIAADLPLLGAIVYDFLWHGRVHRVYLWGGSALVASQFLAIAIIDTGPWQTMTATLIGIAQ